MSSQGKMQTGPRYRVLVVDDSAVYRRMIIGILGRHPEYTVVGEAENGGEAIKEVILKSPDLVTLDLEMPGMDGFTFLRWLMFAKPTKTVVVTSRESNRSVFKALELGAFDFVIKPGEQKPGLLESLERDLIFKLSAAVKGDLAKVTGRLAEEHPRRRLQPPAGEDWHSPVTGVLMAASTGGPPAIQRLLQALPGDFPVPILISQHMPVGFTSLFARRLAGIASLSVREARDREQVTQGVFISPGDHHMILEKRAGGVRVRLVPQSPGDRYVPSADRLILSGAEVLGKGGLGVILTGMGEDGIVGLEALKKVGGKVIAEHESSCVVYGMPRAAIERKLADHVLPLEEIAPVLVKIGRGGKA